MNFVRAGAISALITLATSLPAHEIETNRLTLVLRDRNHLSLSYFIDYPGALHRALAPSRPFSEFILTHSAMAPAEFQKAVSRAHERLQAGTTLGLVSGKLVITGWKWPSAERAQGLLREIAMAAIVAPSDHAHLPPLEVRAEAVASQSIDALDVRLPRELQEVVVVSYRPKQVVAKPDGKPARVRF